MSQLILLQIPWGGSSWSTCCATCGYGALALQIMQILGEEYSMEEYSMEEYVMASSLFSCFPWGRILDGRILDVALPRSMSHCLGSAALPESNLLEPLAHARPAAFRAFLGGQAFLAFLGCLECFLESLEDGLDDLGEELGRTRS